MGDRSYKPNLEPIIMNKIAKRQAEICLALVQELDRAVIEGKQPADQYLALFYRRHREYGARDRRFLSNAVFSWFRWRGWLKTPTAENIARAILLDAAEIPAQLEYLLENSGLTRAEIKPLGARPVEQKAEYLRGLLNAGARRIDESVPEEPANSFACRTDPSAHFIKCAANFGVSLSAEGARPELGQGFAFDVKFLCAELVPNWFSDAIFIPADIEHDLHLKQCARAFQSRPPTWLRLPADRIGQALAALRKAGLEIESHPLIKTAVFVKGDKSFDAGKFPEIEVQDLASQGVGLCCAPQPGQAWWDMCAGAGGKSLHLADLMQDRGIILATDIRPATLSQLAKRLQKSGQHSVRPLLWDGSADPAPTIKFDGILIDAPCSGLGTWARNPDARWRTAPGQIRESADIQKKLLRRAAEKLKPGGRLVYSTCTLTRAENTDVIAAFLEQYRECRLEKLINPLNGEPASGIIWIWPWEENCNGMFLAVMKKP